MVKLFVLPFRRKINPDDYSSGSVLYQLSYERRSVMLALLHSAVPMAPSEVADELGFNQPNRKVPGKFTHQSWRQRRALRQLMKTMANDGQICRLSYGQYILWSERSKYPAEEPCNARTLIIDMLDEALDDSPDGKPLFRLKEFQARYPDRKPRTVRNVLAHMRTFGFVERVDKGTWQWTGLMPLDQYEADC